MVDKTLDKINTFVPEKWRWVLQHGGFRKYFKNTGWMFLGRIFSLIVSFFVGVYIARYLGPSDYGLLSYVISFVGLFSFLASLGVDNVVGREILNKKYDINKIIGTGISLKLIGALFSILVIFLVTIFISSDKYLIFLVSIFSFSYIFYAFNIIEVYFNSQVLSKYSITVMAISTFIAAILKVLFIYTGLNLTWILSVYVFEILLIAIGLLFVFYYKNKKFDIFCFNKKIAIMILKDSWPLMLTSIAIGVYMKIDQVLIKNMIDNSATGVYAVAVKLSEAWYFIPSLICSSVFPALVNAKKDSYFVFKSRMSKLYSLIFWISFLVAIIVSFFARFIIVKLFGLEYIGAVDVLRIHIWAGISISLGIALNQYLLIEEKTKISAIITIIGASTNIILNLLLIPSFGILGAAIATLISYFLSISSILFFKNLRQHFYLIIKSIFLLN